MSEEQHRIKKIELDLLTRVHCDSKVLDTFRTNLFRLGNIGFSKLQRNTEASTGIACLADAIHYDENDDTPIERIHEYITSISRLDDGTSVFGEVYSATLLNQKNAFIYKVAKRGDLTHETAVGFLALNPLRKVTPHFMQTYTSFFCSPPVAGQPQVWCTDSGEQVRYLVAENIVDGIPLRKFLATGTTERIVLCLLMTFDGLLVAQRACKFIHNDLHCENVMVQTHREAQSIPYYTESAKPLWLSTLDVPKIIDFGYAAFMHDGQWLHAFPKKFSNPNYLFDMYKLICFCGEEALRIKRMDVLAIFEKMFAYFNEGTLKNRIVRRLYDKKDYYEIKSSRNSPIDFIRYLEKEFQSILRSHISYTPSGNSMHTESAMQFARLIMTNSDLNRLSDYMYLQEKLPSMSPHLQYLAKQKLSAFSLTKFLESDMGYPYFDTELKKLHSYTSTDLSIATAKQFVTDWFATQLITTRLKVVRDALELHPDISIDTFEMYKNQLNSLLDNYDDYLDAMEKQLRIKPSRELNTLYTQIVMQ